MQIMDKLNKISGLSGKYMALIILLVAAASLFFPAGFMFIKLSYMNPLLMVIMFGMGMTLKAQDFVLIFSHPREIIFGAIAQYCIMPALAFGLGCLFHLDTALMAGVVLVGTCPGGTASNVITYLSKGDVALSVCMTGVNTLLSPFLTPLITYQILKTSVETDITAMFIGIINVILVPIILGILVNKFFGKFIQKFMNLLPVVSVFAICTIIASVISHNAEKIFAAGMIILAVVILHNFFGYLLGFFVGKLLGLNPEKIKAFSIEIGMQNSGLAASLANTTFPAMPEAAVPGAMFSVWHNISGGMLAQIYRNWNSKPKEDN